MIAIERSVFAATVQTRLVPWRRLAYLICGDWALAEDVVQVAALRMAIAWDRIEGRGFDSYGRRVVVRAAIDECRRSHRRVERLVDAPDRQCAVGDAEAGLDVRRLLQLLPVQQRSVLVLRFFNDLSVAETAIALRISQGTVKSHTARGLTSLRGLMNPPSADVNPPTITKAAPR